MARMKGFWNLERIWILLLVFVPAAMWIRAWSFNEMARRFPVLVAAVVFVLSAYLLAGQVFAWNRGDRDKLLDAPSAPPIMPWWATIALSVGFIAVAMAFGFNTGLWFFTTVAAIRLGLKWSYSVIYGGLFALFIWYSFGILLRIPLTEGALIHLF